MFKNSQKQEIAEVITSRGMTARDFDLRIDETGQILSLRHKGQGNNFVFGIQLRNGASFNVTYQPSANSLAETTASAINWSNVLTRLGQWVSYVNAELVADDPWAELDENNAFEGEDTNFTPAELEIVDRAIDVSFAKLIEQAQSNGVTKTLEDIQEDIRELKDAARKNTRFKWRDLFMGVIASKVADWGLDQGVIQIVLDALLEVAMPVLQIVA